MNLESLPDELFLDLFEYITIADLLQTFQDLNDRFKKILFTHFRTRKDLDFQMMSKTDLEIFSHQHLPSIINHIVSLRLFNDEKLSKITYLIFFSSFNLRNFIYLRSLSIYHANSNQINEILIECHHLPHLSHLNLIQCHLSNEGFNNIWNLSKLTHCHLELSEWDTPALTVISVSLKYLHIEVLSIHEGININYLLQYTPHLRHLRIPATYPSVDQNIIFAPSITILKIYCENVYNDLFILFQSIPNLYCLTIDAATDFCRDGRRWEQIIVTYLRKLKKFQFKTQGKLLNIEDKEEQVDKILDSFRSPFWLDEHQWFVQCHWNLNNNMYLYTLPYGFSSFHIENMRSKSTCPHFDRYCLLDSVTTLHYEFSISRDVVLPNFHFPNIENLELKLPLDIQFFKIFPTLDKLTKLTVSVIGPYDPCQLQSLLDCAPFLYSLSFDKWFTTRQMPLADITNVSIRKLDLRISEYNHRVWYFNSREFPALTRSPLGIQCEVLLINVENRTDILDLIDRMTNLQKLIVGFREKVEDKLLWPSMDKFIVWLRRRLSPIYTVTHSKEYIIELDKVK